jgi:hypothetical protein
MVFAPLRERGFGDVYGVRRMTAPELIRAVNRKAVPDRLLIEAVAIIQGQVKLIEDMYERINVMRSILEKRAMKLEHQQEGTT